MRWICCLALLGLLLSGCCHTCRERPTPAPVAVPPEVPAPHRLVYLDWPSQYVPDFVVIQGGRQFVLQPDIPEEVWRQ